MNPGICVAIESTILTSQISKSSLFSELEIGHDPLVNMFDMSCLLPPIQCVQCGPRAPIYLNSFCHVRLSLHRENHDVLFTSTIEPICFMWKKLTCVNSAAPSLRLNVCGCRVTVWHGKQRDYQLLFVDPFDPQEPWPSCVPMSTRIRSSF